MMNNNAALSIDNSLTPTREELEEALCILTHTHEDNPSRLLQIIIELNGYVQERRVNFLDLHEPLRKTLANLYKVPEKAQGNRAFYKRVVAKIYCYYGNGFGRFKTYVTQYKLPFQANQYQFRNTVIGMLGEAYRSLQARVVQNFSVLQINPLEERQVRDVEPILFNLQANFSQKSAEVFKQEIKNLFNLERREEIDLTASFQFYHQLREKMEARQAQLSPQARLALDTPIGRYPKDKDVFTPDYATHADVYYNLTTYKQFPKHHHVVEDDPSIWTSQVQQEIVALFLQLRDLSKVRIRFQNKYMEPQLTCIGRLKRKLIKIIRGTVRLLQRFYKEHQDDVSPPLPKMMEIDEDKVKLLIGSPFEVKACLLEFFRQTYISYRTLCEIINQINIFIKEKSLQRFQKTTASKAIIFSL